MAYAEPLQRLASKNPPHHETPVARYTFFKQSHQAGKLHPSFANMKAWEMRYLMPFYDNASLAWIQDHIRIPLGRLPEGQGCTIYQGCSVFGDGLSARRFHLPWQLAGQSMGENHVKHGGVCGTLSGVGIALAISRGIPACHAAQPPTHCAFTVRLARHQWVGGFGGPNGRASQGFYGLYSPHDQLLVDAIFCQPEKVLASRRLAWLGHRYQAPTSAKQATLAFHEAVKAQPLNVEAWRDYTDWMYQLKKDQPAELLAVLDELVASPFFRLFPSARGAELADDVLAKACAQMPLEKHKELLLDLYAKVGKVGAPDALIQRLRYHFRLFHGDSPQRRDFLRRMIRMQWNTENVHTLWRVTNRNMGGSKTPPDEQMAAMGGPWPFDSTLAEKDARAWRSCRGTITRFATYVSDHFTYPEALDAWRGLAQSNLPGYTAGLRDQVARINSKIPAFTAPPGQLLSKDGLLHLSTLHRPDLPLLYPLALTAAGGQLQTKGESDPAISLRLGTPGTISGIVVTPQFESERAAKTILPLSVFTSTDGKQWTKVSTLAEYQPTWTLDLSAKAQQAAYVKFACHHDLPRELLLRRILVYGTPNR